MELVTETSLPKRPAPAPPTRPKPTRKVPMYPPSFKRVEAGDSPEDSDLVMSVEERCVRVCVCVRMCVCVHECVRD